MCVAPKYALFVVPPSASSCVLVFPTITAPASRSSRTVVASLAGTRSLSAPVPPAVTTPAVSYRSFTAIGIPSSGPSRVPACARSIAAAASTRAVRAIRRTNELSRSSVSSIRASEDSSSSVGVVSPASIAALAPASVEWVGVEAIVASSAVVVCED